MSNPSPLARNYTKPLSLPKISSASASPSPDHRIVEEPEQTSTVVIVAVNIFTGPFTDQFLMLGHLSEDTFPWDTFNCFKLP